MGFEIRTVTEDEFAAWQLVVQTAFFGTTPLPAGAEWKRPFVDLDRCWAALDGDRPVATLRSFANELTVPGGALLPVDAITNVAVFGTHRRRGALNAMMTANLAQATERGDAVSILIAARWMIYGRYGFGPATESAGYTVDARSFELRPGLSDSGSVSLTDAVTLRGQVDEIFDRFRAGQPGAIRRQPELVDRSLGLGTAPPEADKWKGFCVVHHDAGGTPDGWVRYHVDDDWTGMEPDCTLHVDDLVAATPEAYVGLWRYCCEIDNVVRVTIADRSVAEPLRWLLTNGRAIVQTQRNDFVWLRVLDVAAALSARTYAIEGRLTLEVTDPLGHAQGRWSLDGGPAGAGCTPTTAPADLTLPAYALGAAYLGGTSLTQLAGAGYVVERTPGALAKAELMFTTATPPWCNTWF